MKKLLIGALAMAASTQASAVTVYSYAFDAADLSGFSSDYEYRNPTSGNNTAAAQYTVADNAFPWNGNFASYADHTGDAAADYMVVNGADAADTVWRNVPSLALSAGAYRFSFWLSNACCNSGFNGGVDPNPAQLWVSTTGGLPYLNTFAFTRTGSAAGIWEEVGVDFTLAQGGNFTFSIVNNQFAPGGNDFGIDDISVSTVAVPEPATWAMLMLGFGLVGAAARRRKTVAAIA